MSVPHATAKTLGVEIVPGQNDDGTAARLIAALDAYLADFADTDGRCPKCDRQLGDILGSFRWGLVNGEGNCSCGWPCRGYHDPTDEHGSIFEQRIPHILPYHPDGVIERPSR